MSVYGSPYPATCGDDLPCPECGLWFRNAPEMHEHRDRKHPVDAMRALRISLLRRLGKHAEADELEARDE